MPTCGKSFLGSFFAKKYNYKQIDGDSDIIIPKINCSLQQYIDIEGEDNFLKLEENLFLNYDFKEENLVITPGGSIIYSEKAMLKLKKIGRIFYLYSSFNVIK